MLGLKEIESVQEKSLNEDRKKKRRIKRRRRSLFPKEEMAQREKDGRRRRKKITIADLTIIENKVAATYKEPKPIATNKIAISSIDKLTDETEKCQAVQIDEKEENIGRPHRVVDEALDAGDEIVTESNISLPVMEVCDEVDSLANKRAMPSMKAIVDQSGMEIEEPPQVISAVEQTGQEQLVPPQREEDTQECSSNEANATLLEGLDGVSAATLTGEKQLESGGILVKPASDEVLMANQAESSEGVDLPVNHSEEQPTVSGKPLAILLAIITGILLVIVATVLVTVKIIKG